MKSNPSSLLRRRTRRKNARSDGGAGSRYHEETIKGTPRVFRRFKLESTRARIDRGLRSYSSPLPFIFYFIFSSGVIFLFLFLILSLLLLAYFTTSSRDTYLLSQLHDSRFFFVRLSLNEATHPTRRHSILIAPITRGARRLLLIVSSSPVSPQHVYATKILMYCLFHRRYFLVASKKAQKINLKFKTPHFFLNNSCKKQTPFSHSRS